MDWTDTEQALRDSLRRWLGDHVDPALQARADLPPRRPPWRALARDLGLLGAGLPEAVGGLGGGLRAHLLVLQTLGEALCAEPYLSSVLIAGQALQATAASAARLPALIAGDHLWAFAHLEPGSRGDADALQTELRREGPGDGWRLHGPKSGVAGAEWASHLIVSAHDRGQPVLLSITADAPGLSCRHGRSLDGGSASALHFDAVAVRAEDRLGGADLLQHLLDLATLGVCAEGLGVTRRLLDDTLEHTRTRRQFGAPLASQQVLQHRLADMHIARVQAQALTWSVATAFEQATPLQRSLAVSSAKVAAAEACRIVGQGAVQIHGAMGVTEELAAGRWFRRATQIEGQFGSRLQHLRRIDRLLAASS